jgi:hypothetical protein
LLFEVALDLLVSAHDLSLDEIELHREHNRPQPQSPGAAGASQLAVKVKN